MGRLDLNSPPTAPPSPTRQTVRELLENPVQPINDMSYFGCLDSVMENSKVGVPSPLPRRGEGRKMSQPGAALSP